MAEAPLSITLYTLFITILFSSAIHGEFHNHQQPNPIRAQKHLHSANNNHSLTAKGAKEEVELQNEQGVIVDHEEIATTTIFQTVTN
ncbi:hypothetical protein V2J09_016863 [Rumex salicifolius]